MQRAAARRGRLLGIGLAMQACSPAGHSPVPPAVLRAPADPPRRLELHATTGADGLSAPVRCALPAGSRSVTVVLTGQSDALYALASFQLGGREHVDTPPGDFVAPMQAAYLRRDVSPPPGSLLQVARLGTFTFQYPYAPGQELPAGELVFRIASTRPASAVALQILIPADDGARVLHVNLFTVSDNPNIAPAPAFLPAAQAILDQAGIRLQVDSLQTIRSARWATIDTLTEPWESPTGTLAELARFGAARVHNEALNIYLVERLPRGMEGVSLGLPGPPQPTSYYFGVVLRRTDPESLGRTFVHEIAHFLSLRHVQTVTPSGLRLTDAIPDTEPSGINLMEHGTRLTPGQIEVLRRSPLLTAT